MHGCIAARTSEQEEEWVTALRMWHRACDRLTIATGEEAKVVIDRMGSSEHSFVAVDVVEGSDHRLNVHLCCCGLVMHPLLGPAASPDEP